VDVYQQLVNFLNMRFETGLSNGESAPMNIKTFECTRILG
jgi:hypothetical protein